MKEIIFQYELNLIFRMLIACICGIAIGFERKNRAKEAGIRTHCIVACASAMMMIISKYGFGDLIDAAADIDADIRLDPSRMAQGIVTGVGFLGAGIIYIQHSTIKGLTTAAGIWATSGIGMAIGAGMYIIGVSATLIILLAQIVLHAKNIFMVSHKPKTLKIYDVEEDNFQETATQLLTEMDITVTDVSIKKSMENTRDYVFYLDMPNKLKEEELANKFSYRCTIDSTI